MNKTSPHAPPYLELALKAANWIQSCSVTTPLGKLWPVNPDRPMEVDSSLYAGYPGIILFFLELYHSTQDSTWLKEAKRAADILVATLPDSSSSVLEGESAGLYTGIAGQGFVLEEVFLNTGEMVYQQAALLCFDILQASAQNAGNGVEWNPVTDMISGSAGIGLFLIYLHRKTKTQAVLDLAIKTGKHLQDLAITEPHGSLSWKMTPDFPRVMPNFSHGTAGIAYFLATLYQETGKASFLKSALAGAKYLLSITSPEGLVCHDFPDGEDLFYLGWCHGPAGTARLYRKMAQITGDPGWTQAILKSAQGILQSGIPDQFAPGFWNNVGICCGNAGVADFFLDLYRLSGTEDYLVFAKRLTENLLGRATPEGDGLKWIHSDIRKEPDILSAETGLMKGASGIGIHLLRWDAFERGTDVLIKMPDSPF